MANAGTVVEHRHATVGVCWTSTVLSDATVATRRLSVTCSDSVGGRIPVIRPFVHTMRPWVRCSLIIGIRGMCIANAVCIHVCEFQMAATDDQSIAARQMDNDTRPVTPPWDTANTTFRCEEYEMWLDLCARDDQYIMKFKDAEEEFLFNTFVEGSLSSKELNKSQKSN